MSTAALRGPHERVLPAAGLKGIKPPVAEQLSHPGECVVDHADGS